MPWRTAEDGTKKFFICKACIQELPTWNEIYNDFWLGKMYTFDPTNPEHIVPDMYWKIPHRQMVIGWMANQFNKDIFEEEGIRDQVFKFIIDNSRTVCDDTIYPIDVRFDIVGLNKEVSVDLAYLNGDISNLEQPAVYTCELPSTGKRFELATDWPTINIKSFNDTTIELRILIQDDDSIHVLHYTSPLYEMIIEKILNIKGVIKYFTGEKVGWKDEAGVLLESQPAIRGCSGSGMDPAL
jgi:hypothetical protein